jgi:hypothetical protein
VFAPGTPAITSFVRRACRASRHGLHFIIPDGFGFLTPALPLVAILIIIRRPLQREIAYLFLFPQGADLLFSRKSPPTRFVSRSTLYFICVRRDIPSQRSFRATIFGGRHNIENHIESHHETTVTTDETAKKA